MRGNGGRSNRPSIFNGRRTHALAPPHPLSQHEVRNILRSHDAAQASPWHGCANASPPDKEHQMHSVNKLRVIGARRPNLWSTENHPRPALGARIWTRLLAALHEFEETGSRAGDPPASGSHSEFPGDRTARSWDGSQKPCMTERIGPRAGIEHIVIAALIVGFALALGFALNELDAAVKDACASLATIATIGN